jgi:hypothetical protein
MKVTPFDVYKTYLALKNHFTNDNYDYFKYSGKSRASVASFNKRKDKYFFERCSRKLNDDEVVNYFVSSFIVHDDPQKVWIGEIIQTGESHYTNWKKKNQSLFYVFSQEIENVFSNKNFDLMFDCKPGHHPQVLKEHLKQNLSLETLIILDKILGYSKKYDKILDDLMWKTVSSKIKKYNPFMAKINITKFKTLLKEIIVK